MDKELKEKLIGILIDNMGYGTIERLAENIITAFDKEGYVVVKKEELAIHTDEPCPTCERIDCICDLREHGFVAIKEKTR